MTSQYDEIANLLVERGDCVALTGAGISAESGIPTFRSKGGLWEKYDPMVYASAEMFRQDPSKSILRSPLPKPICVSRKRPAQPFPIFLRR